MNPSLYITHPLTLRPCIRILEVPFLLSLYLLLHVSI